VLYGSETSLNDREEIKAAFNDTEDPVRVLLATDVASEGLNLQETARLLLHYEIPWNPSRLEQRNGRLDRYGQARDVYIHHFTSEDDADLRFLGFVVAKVEEIREDLGSVGEVFDAAFQRRFLEMDDADTVITATDRAVQSARNQVESERSVNLKEGSEALERLERLRTELDLRPETLRDTLEVALRMEAGRPCLEAVGTHGKSRLTDYPASWRTVVDHTLRRRVRYGIGALAGLAFDPKTFLQQQGGRTVFRPSKDTRLIHLGHPLYRLALNAFARRRFRPGIEGATRWTVTRGQIPAGADSLVILHLEELAVNELRETIHQWIRTVRIPFSSGLLQPTLPHVVPLEDSTSHQDVSPEALRQARQVWEEVAEDLRDWMNSHRQEVEHTIAKALETERHSALREETARFRERIQEVGRLMQRTTLQSLQREIEKRERKLEAGILLDEMRRTLDAERASLQEELRIRSERYEELRGRLASEQTRVTEYLLRRRYSLRGGGVQVFPVAVEIRLGEAER
jgi:hypothetical protein